MIFGPGREERLRIQGLGIAHERNPHADAEEKIAEAERLMAFLKGERRANPQRSIPQKMAGDENTNRWGDFRLPKRNRPD